MPAKGRGSWNERRPGPSDYPVVSFPAIMRFKRVPVPEE